MRKKMSSFQIILLGFVLLIIIGAILLMLPISSKDRSFTPFIDSLFTSTSAACVTGLVIYDTYSHWSLFGQIVILILIQIGGLGVVTFVSSIAIISKRKIGLFERNTIKESVSAYNVGGVVKLIIFILKITFVCEFVGFLLLLIAFCKDFGLKGAWYSLFHSISAFCNAGFDLMGDFSSLTVYYGSILVNVVITLLIIVGGIGFIVWDDILKNKLNIKKYSLQSKVVLFTSLILIVIPFIYFMIFEFDGYSFKEKILLSFFQSVTPRTAGFNTANLNSLSAPSISIITILMLIGGSPGSTAGGFKTTTIAVLFAIIINSFKRKQTIEIAKRRIEDDVIKNAISLVLIYSILFFVSGVIISQIENIELSKCLFETASAIGTVGLSLGITSSLSIASKIILMFLMFFGRVGGFTLIYATVNNLQNNVSKLPVEKIMIG